MEKAAPVSLPGPTGLIGGNVMVLDPGSQLLVARGPAAGPALLRDQPVWLCVRVAGDVGEESPDEVLAGFRKGAGGSGS